MKDKINKKKKKFTDVIFELDHCIKHWKHFEKASFNNFTFDKRLPPA